MEQDFPDIQDVEFKEQTTLNQKPTVVCDKHGDIGDYVFRVHMPEFGFENEHYCLVCVAEYLQMITAEVKLTVPTEETKE